MQETQVWSLGAGRSHGGGHGYPLHYSCLENPMDRGAWLDHGVTKSQTWLSDHMVWCDDGRKWVRGDRGRRVLGTKHNMAAKDKTPCRRRGAGSQEPSSPSQPHQPLSSRTSKWSYCPLSCPVTVSTSVMRGAIPQGLIPPPPLLFSSLPPLAQDMGQNIHLCFFPKCRGSTYMNYLLKNTSKLPLFSCSAARNKMPLEWGKW